MLKTKSLTVINELKRNMLILEDKIVKQVILITSYGDISEEVKNRRLKLPEHRKHIET